MPGPDHKASATIDEFKKLVTDIRELTAAIGEGREKQFSAEEVRIKDMARKSIVAARDIAKGTIISADDICYKRPGTGISPTSCAEVIGRRAINSIEANRLISRSSLD